MSEDEVKDDVDFEPEDELGSVGALQAKLKKVKDELAAAKKERQAYLDGWQRCKADAINQKNENLQNLSRARTAGKEQVLESLLPVLDSFDIAMTGGAWEKTDAAWRSGIESIRNQFLTALESNGITSFGKEGDSYDPLMHEILEEVDDAGKAGIVIRVVRRGWRLENKIVRPAHVVIGRFRS